MASPSTAGLSLGWNWPIKGQAAGDAADEERDSSVRCRVAGPKCLNLRRASSLDSMTDYAQLLRAIAAQVLDARLSNGARVLDASDLRTWLIELAEKAEQSENVEHFLSQI